jgi:hypothetical protein
VQIATAMKIGLSLWIPAWATAAHGGIRPAFWLSRCAWEATDVVELAVAPGKAHFRVTATLKSRTRSGAIKMLPELAPPTGDRSPLRILAYMPHLRSYEKAPPVRAADRLIVFLRPGDEPANSTLLTSTVWFQDGDAYAFRQTTNPGPSHLVVISEPNVHLFDGKAITKPESGESRVRREIGRLLQLRGHYEHALSDPNREARAVELARLVTSRDDVVIRGVLDALIRDGPEAAHALSPYLKDDTLLGAHSQLLDAIAKTGVRDIRLDSIIRREKSYWSQTCQQNLHKNWAVSYGEPPAKHYMRLVSTLMTVRALGINSDLPAVREFRTAIEHCRHLSSQGELVKILETLLEGSN